jgi:predicted GNAT family acetyltransferase
MVLFIYRKELLMNFIHEQNKIYLNDENNHMIAVVTFPKAEENVVNIDHTYVDNSLRGQGIAGKLMEEAALQLRESHQKAHLSCSYAVKWFEEHPDYTDVLLK